MAFDRSCYYDESPGSGPDSGHVGRVPRAFEAAPHTQLVDTAGRVGPLQPSATYAALIARRDRPGATEFVPVTATYVRVGSVKIVTASGALR
jgi:hypothetical protein